MSLSNRNESNKRGILQKLSKAGRPKSTSTASHGTSESLLKQKCPVPTCSVATRSDHLKTHWKRMVLFTSGGEPVDETSDEFKAMSNDKRQHTLYFTTHGYTATNLPFAKNVAAASISPKPVASVKDIFRKQKEPAKNVDEGVNLKDAEEPAAAAAAVIADAPPVEEGLNLQVPLQPPPPPPPPTATTLN